MRTGGTPGPWPLSPGLGHRGGVLWGGLPRPARWPVQVVFDQRAGFGGVPLGGAGVGAEDGAVAADQEGGRQAGDPEGPEQRPLGVVVEPQVGEPQAFGEGPDHLDSGAVDGDRHHAQAPVAERRLQAVMQVLYEGLADSKYRPCPLLVKYVEAGWLGRKAGRGFYDYSGEAPVPTR